MAQAFEIPDEIRYGKPDSASSHACDGPRRPPQGTQQRFPDRRSRSDPAADRLLEYGSGFGPPQAHQPCPAAPLTGPNPGPAIPARLIVSVGFDKVRPLPV